jgi:hypothetical protein
MSGLMIGHCIREVSNRFMETKPDSVFFLKRSVLKTASPISR